MVPPLRKIRPFARFAWFLLLWNVLVILWGAYVRATGSGAGCGEHWPLCNGAVIPESPTWHTLVEYSHRVSSGGALLFVAVLAVWAMRLYPKRDPVRRAALGALIFTLSEALIGAGLVLFRLVERNESAFRAVSLSTHLVNTLILLAFLSATAWWSSGQPTPAQDSRFSVPLAIALLGTMAAGVTGAVTALGDTLFASASLSAGLAEDFRASAHILTRLRIVHPIIAMASGILVLIAAGRGPQTGFAWFVRTLVFVQIASGLVNVYLLAPVWMQIIHLLLADALWIALVLYSLKSWGQSAALPIGAERELLTKLNVVA